MRRGERNKISVSQDGVRLECEFRHLSLAEYLTALHVHVTGDNLLGKKICKICQTVASISVTNQFHEFLNIIFGGIFASEVN